MRGIKSIKSIKYRQRLAVVLAVAALALTASACGSRLTGNQAALAQGAFGHSGSGSNTSGTGTGAQALGASSSTGCGSTTTSTPSTTTTTAKSSGAKTTTTTTKPASTSSNSSTTTTTTAPCPAGSTTPGLASGATGGTSSGAHPAAAGATAAGAANQAALAGAGADAGACGANGNQTPAGGNGGATATGVTATTITVGNIASISGVVPGLTESAQQATEAWAAYVNSTGGICGRQVKVQPFDDGSDSSTNYADAEQACSSDFAMVGNASGFDDGSATAVGGCGIPTMAGEVSTGAAGNTADIFGASPGNSHYYPLGPGNYIKSLYPNAIKHAAEIYLQVPATQEQATHEIAANTSIGFVYTPAAGIATTPTNANYGSIVQELQSNGSQYVSEYSDDDSAERLLEAMQQANFAPQVVDWISEEYTPSFAQQTSPESNGNLVAMTATDGYEDASANPGLQLMETWLNRVAPGYNHDIFAILAWSAGLAFEQAAKEVGPDLTRAALITKLQGINNWTGDGVTPPTNIGQKIPSKCFYYEKIQNGAFQRVYPTAANTYDCNSSYLQY